MTDKKDDTQKEIRKYISLNSRHIYYVIFFLDLPSISVAVALVTLIADKSPQ